MGTSTVSPSFSRFWREVLGAGAVEAFCIALALTTGGSLFQVPGLLRQNPFGLRELCSLVAAALCAFASWGFYRFVADLMHSDGLRSQHPGRVAWWLTGGVWVTAWVVTLCAESAATLTYAVFAAIELGSLLAMPLVLALLIACVRRHERARSDWRAWAGFVAGCTIPLPWMLALAAHL